MKKLFQLSALLCCLLMVWGCPNEPDTPDVPEDPNDRTYEMEAVSSVEYPEISAEGGEFTIKFKTDADASIIQPSSDVPWITVSTKTKAVKTLQVFINVLSNTGVDSRHGTVTIKAGKSSLKFTVSQKGVDPKIDIAITEYNVEAEGGNVTVNVDSNVSYKVAIDVDWIKQEGSAFKVEANDSEEERSGKVTFSYGELSKSVTIKQAGKEHVVPPYITVSKTAVSVPAAGESVTIEVESNVEYKTTIGAGWVTGAVPTFVVAANPETKERSTTITFSYEGISQVVTITQAAKPEDPYINVDSPAVNVPAAGETFEIGVTSNVQYNVSVDKTWVSVNGKSVTVQENKEYTERTATITFSYGGKTYATVTITQAAAIEPDVLEYVGNDPTFYVSADGDNITVKIRTNVNYGTPAISANWITQTKAKTMREDEMAFAVAANDGDAREGTITFSYADLKCVVTVKQAEKVNIEEPYITVVTTTYNIPAAGGNATLDVTSNVAYNTETGADWVTVEGTHMSVAENTAYEPRETTVTFSYENISKSITVKQAAAIEPDELEFVGDQPTFTVPWEGGEISFKIRTNGQYTTSIGASWITIPQTRASREEDLTFMVAANDGDARNTQITVTLNDITLTVIVAQEAYVPPTPPEQPYLTLNPASLDVPASGGAFVVNVSTNCEYEVINGATWVTEEAVEGGYKFTVSENTDTKPRTTDIFFASDELGGEDVKLVVTQAAAEEQGDPFDVGPDLSVNGTANSYVVIRAGDYSFDASVMGNGPDGFLWDDTRAVDAFLWPKGADKTTISKNGKPSKAFVLWDEGGVVTNVQYNSSTKRITFTATGNKGAALIGLYDKYADEATKEADNAFWSWLIWCTDSPQRYTLVDLMYNEYVILDRNVGATSANPADGKATYGYFFQFGRPNPLRAYIGICRDMQSCQTEMKEALSHPTYVYLGGDKTNEWYNQGKSSLATVTADLWGDPRHIYATVGEDARDHHPQISTPYELKKTIYDPCPPGWMVAPERTWEMAGLLKELPYNIRFTDDGAFIPTENGDTFFPFAGFITLLQSDEIAYGDRSKLGYEGFKGYKDVLPPEAIGGGHSCHEYRTQASVYTSATGHISVYGTDSDQWWLFGGKFFFLSPDSSDWEGCTGTCRGTIRQKAFPVRCAKEFKK